MVKLNGNIDFVGVQKTGPKSLYLHFKGSKEGKNSTKRKTPPSSTGSWDGSRTQGLVFEKEIE